MNEPSQAQGLVQEEGAEYGNDDHAQWVEGGDEDGAPCLHHHSLDVVLHPGAYYPLHCHCQIHQVVRLILFNSILTKLLTL